MKYGNGCRFEFETLEMRAHASASRVIGYLPEYEYAGTIGKIDWSAITQLNYFSAVPSSSTGAMPSRSDENLNLSHMYSAVKIAHKHDVKVSIVIGGAGLDGSLQAIAASSTLQTAFARSAAAFCARYGLDGIDLDWEPLNPTAAQINNYGNLIDKLRKTAKNLTLSAAVNPEKLPIAPTDSKSAYVLNKTAVKDLNLIGVMAYDLDYANHAPTSRSINDLNAWGAYLKANGVSKSKLILGLPFYGRAGTSWSDSTAVSYADLVNASIEQNRKPRASDDRLNIRFDNDVFNGQMTAWFFNGPSTIARKTQYAIDNDFGGVMIWDLGQDHFAANGKYDAYSLLPAIKRTISARA